MKDITQDGQRVRYVSLQGADKRVSGLLCAQVYWKVHHGWDDESSPNYAVLLISAQNTAA